MNSRGYWNSCVSEIANSDQLGDEGLAVKNFGCVVWPSVAAMALGFTANLASAQVVGLTPIGTDPKLGTSSAVIVDRVPLVYTSQLMATSSEATLKDLDSEQQSHAVLSRLDEALRLRGATLQTTAKLNIYVANSDVGDSVRRVLATRFATEVHPAVSVVQSQLPLKESLVAMDAVAVAISSQLPTLHRNEKLSGHPRIHHAATLKPGPRVYVSGQAEKGGNLAEATVKTLESLKRTLKQLGTDWSHVVQIKCFLTPMSDVRAAEEAIVASFEGFAPPCVFVEWESSLPNEIELVASLPGNDGTSSPQEPIEFLTPPGMSASPVFCRVVRVNDPRTIFVSGLISRHPANGEGQVLDVFAQLEEILKVGGSDLRHLAKATYYVSDIHANTQLNELRPKFYDPKRPPAASKAQVFGIGVRERSLSIDMIAIPREPRLP